MTSYFKDNVRYEVWYTEKHPTQLFITSKRDEAMFMAKRLSPAYGREFIEVLEVRSTSIPIE